MKKVIIFVAILILLAHVCEAKWYPITIHNHSTFSDGAQTPAMVKNIAVSFGSAALIETDHLEDINNKRKSFPRADIVTNDYGYDNYIRQFSVTKPLLCLAGTEITTGDGSHVLALANISKVFRANLNKVGQQQVITRLNGLSALPVAAHPHMILYPFNKDKAQGICGIEFFNEDATGYAKTLEWYLKLVAAGKSPFVTAGCDSHAPDAKSWQKKTFVWSDKPLSSGVLLDSITAGCTYAANGGAYFESQNLIPQFMTQRVKRPKFEFVIGFITVTNSKKTIRIYRDGKLAEGSSITLPLGKTKYTYKWEDIQATKGRHVYVIEVEGCLITSLICLDVQDDKAVLPPVVNKDNYDDWSPQPIASNNSINDFFLGLGRRIAFLSNRSGRTMIYQADFDENRNLQRVVPVYDLTGFLEQFKFRSDGQGILLMDKQNKIYLLVVDPVSYAKQLFNLHLQGGKSFFLSWAEENNFYFSSAKGNFYLQVIDRQYNDDANKIVVETGEIQNLSADMRFLTVAKDSRGFNQLCLVNPCAIVAKWLTSGSYDNINPSIGQIGAIVPIGMDSPVVFSTKKKGNFDLAVIRGDNKPPEIINSDSSNETEPCWIFNCEEILFVSDRTGRKKIWRLNTDNLKQGLVNLK